MRAWACSLALGVAACGNAERTPSAESGGSTSGLTGGTSAGGASAGGASASGNSAGAEARSGNAGEDSGGSGSSGRAGSSGRGGGGAVDAGGEGGATPMGGRISTTGGKGPSVSGGEGGDVGVAGAAGAAGQCSEPYVACGCGCCGGVTPMQRCYYPEMSGSLEDIIAQDQQLSASPGCANAGCSIGIEYVCCTPESAPVIDATYEVRAVSTALDRVTISRTTSGADGRCDAITLVSPSTVNDRFVIETAESWSVGLTEGRFCAQSSVLNAIGGVGRVEWHGSPCVADFDFTLFFPSAAGAPVAVRFKAEDVVVKNDGALRCQ